MKRDLDTNSGFTPLGSFFTADRDEAHDASEAHASREIDPDLPLNRWTLLAAVIAVALMVVWSHFDPMGFAP